MPLDLQCELPPDSSALACLVADARQPQDTRDRGLERLTPMIEAIARQVAGGFRSGSHHDLIAESGSIVWLRMHHFDPARGRFEDWCRVVLYHHACDVWRKANRGPVLPAAGGDEANAAMESVAMGDARDTSEEAMDRCRELRTVLDRIVWPPSRAVHYFAVLLLQLRLAAARHMTGEQLSRDASWRAELPQYVEWLLPWHPDEHQARLKPGWPPLEALWAAICWAIRDPAAKIEAEVICGSIAPLLPAAAQLTPDVWNHWVHRAKEQARTRVQDDAVWTRCFSRLLPDHPRGGTP
jgi:DNA-directed RNA polymerase specialized sigma24 family protein